MNQLESKNYFQPTRIRNTYKRLKRCMNRLFQQLGRHNTTRRQEELDFSTANTRTVACGTRAQHQLDMSVAGTTSNTGTRGVHTQSQLHASHNIDPAESDVTTDIKQSSAFFQNAHACKISGSPSFQNQNVGSIINVYGGEKDGLEIVKGFVSFDAQFDSSVQDPQCRCHPGTRENVLKRLRDWVDTPKAKERIFWLYGPAGAGKSAIAQTIASSYARPKVAATFFFFKSDVNRNDGNRLFTTLAYQLAFSIPDIKNHIANSLSERPDLPGTGVETQFNQLLVRPMQVLNDYATQQLAPVIVIDGVDECIDETVQGRFLKIIGDAVADDRFPLRFLIVSRPELHIAQTIRRCQTPVLTIDLAKLDDANRDIGKYLIDEFSRIASEQGLDPAWLGPEIIRDIVYKSSGNFIYAPVVIKFVGDPYSFAKTQLDIVLNIKPPKTMSPFAILDQLFLEILRRVPDQDFVKRYLTLLTARISVSSKYGDLHKDDAVLMHVSEEEFHGNLRRMRSLLRFEPSIDVHHRSFLDFLHDSSRSGQYHTGKQGEIWRYLEVFVDSVVRYIYAVIEQPDHHNTSHFNPRFRVVIDGFPTKLDLPGNQWQEMMQPLLDLQDNLLQIPNFTSTWHLLSCDSCTVFYLLRELLHRGIFEGQPDGQFVMNTQKRRSVPSSNTTETEKKTNSNDLDSILRLLLAHLPEIMENWSPNEEVIRLMSAILHLDSTEVARSVRSVSNAQKLVDLLGYMIHVNDTLKRVHPDAMRKAGLLALEFFTRVLIVPPSLFSHDDGKNSLFRHISSNNTIPTQILSETIFASRVLDRGYTIPMLGGYKTGSKSVYFRGDVEGNILSMKQWRQESSPSSVTSIQIMLAVAKTIQYFHSMGVVLYDGFSSRDILLDSDLRPKIFCLCSTSRSLLVNQCEEWFSPAHNILSFGYIFYEMCSGTKPLISSEKRRSIITQRGSVTGMPEYVRQLIQRCCAEGPGSRPTIDKIVKEMESWKIH